MAKGSAVSKIHIALEANAQRLSKGLQSGLASIRSFVGRSSRLFSGMIPTSILQGIGQGIGQRLTGAFTAAIGPSFDTIDKLAKQADLVGIATEKLAAYRHAAGLAGLGAQEFDGSLLRMNRRLAMAAQGTGPAAKAYEQLGLSASRLASLPADQKLKAIADAMEGVEGQGQRAALAFQIFGQSGMAMPQMLRGGSAALEDAERHAESLGIALSRVDAAKVEIANDSIANMGALWEGFINQMTVAMAPTLTAIAQTLTEVGQDGMSAGGRIASAFENVGWVIAKIQDAVTAVGAAFNWLQGAVNKVLAAISRALNKLDAWTGNRLFGGALEFFEEEFDRVADEKFAEAGRKWEDALAGRAGNAFLDKIEEANKLAEQIAETAASRLEAIELPEPKARDRDLRVGFAQEGTSAAANAVLAAQAAMREAQEAMDAGDDDSDELQQLNATADEQLAVTQQHTRILNRVEQHLAGGLLATAEV